jgi:hypothetical protein
MIYSVSFGPPHELGVSAYRDVLLTRTVKNMASAAHQYKVYTIIHVCRFWIGSPLAQLDVYQVGDTTSSSVY